MKENVSYKRELKGRAWSLINATSTQFRDFFIAEAKVLRREVVYGTGRPEIEEVIVFRQPKVQRIFRSVFSRKNLRT